MSLTFEATRDFFESVKEVQILLDLVDNDSHEENRELFLKLSVVSLVTKFQVFVEQILTESLYILRTSNISSSDLPVHMVMNSLKLSISENNVFNNLLKHANYNEDKKQAVIRYIKSIEYFTDQSKEIDDNFQIETKFPLGKTGKTQLKNLLRQFDGDDNCLDNLKCKNDDDEEISIDMGKLDSLLQTRHLIIHQDKFNGTNITVKNHISFCANMVKGIDNYLAQKLKAISPTLLQNFGQANQYPF